MPDEWIAAHKRLRIRASQLGRCPRYSQRWVKLSTSFASIHPAITLQYAESRVFVPRTVPNKAVRASPPFSSGVRQGKVIDSGHEPAPPKETA
jgi:hypothetical protein